MAWGVDGSQLSVIVVGLALCACSKMCNVLLLTDRALFLAAAVLSLEHRRCAMGCRVAVAQKRLNMKSLLAFAAGQDHRHHRRAHTTEEHRPAGLSGGSCAIRTLVTIVMQSASPIAASGCYSDSFTAL